MGLSRTLDKDVIAYFTVMSYEGQKIKPPPGGGFNQTESD